MMDMNRGDRLPDLIVDLSGESGPVNLTSAVEIKFLAYMGGVNVIDRAVTGNSTGVITMPWQAGDTDNAGLLGCKWEVTWSDGKVQTFPVSGFEWVRIHPDP